MARLNIEDDVWISPRFERLREKLGSKRLAIGTLVDFWRLAQKYWIQEESLIPFQEFELGEFPEALFECAYAEKREDGVYAKGSKDFLGWYKGWIEQKREAGKHRAEKAKRNENGTFQRISSDKPAKATEIQLSSSFSSSFSNKETTNTPPEDAVSSKPVTDVAPFIATYVKAFQNRYGTETRPDLSGKVLGQVKRLVKDVGLSRSCDLIQAFMQMEDKWFLTKGHDFATFVANIQKIGIAFDTGKFSPDSAAAVDIEKILRRSASGTN